MAQRNTWSPARAAGLAGLLLTILATPALAEGVQWEALSIEQALEKAQALDRLVMVDIYATHCHQCQTMDEELWSTPAGAELAEGLVAVKFPSDKPAGTNVQRRYPILGLPLVIFLHPDGTELDRVVGYRDRDSFLREAQALKEGIDPLPGIERALAAQESAPLLFAVFERYIFRKRIGEAEVLLERLIRLDPEHKGGQSTQALALLAQYYDYFAHDLERAQFLWRTIVEQYPNSGAVTSGLKETFEFHQQTGSLEDWQAWVCPIALAHPQARYLNRYTATFALRGGLGGDCLARAARNASALEADARQKVYMDSIAVVLERPKGTK